MVYNRAMARKRRLWWAGAVLLTLLAGAGIAGAKLWPIWLEIDAETEILADAHRDHTAPHPGWSFPARVYSAPAPLALPPLRRVRQAAARGYVPACPPQAPGEYCEESGEVTPRSGDSMEPVLLGVLIGPDAEVRWHLPLDEAPPALLAAIVSAEDVAFRDHRGVNVPALARATWINARGASYAQGASTITMQVVRAFSQRKDKTITRKLREIAAAFSLERHMSKDEILQAYLDAPYLGQHGGLSICGFRAAAQYYFGTDVDGLTLGQAATLAGMLPAPGRYAPDTHPEAARARRDLVLGRMAEAGWDVTDALDEPIAASAHEPLPPIQHPAYLQAARKWLEDAVPREQLYGAGLTVYTAMDLVAQGTTETFMPEQATYLEGVVGRRGPAPLETVAVLIDARTGHLSAIYGGTQQASTDFSRATQARRQAGSAFKPLVYALAFSQTDEDGHAAWRPHHTVSNLYRTFPDTDGWTPKNIQADYSASTTLGHALVRSQNVATATLLQELGGPRPLIDFATQLGFDTGSFPEELGLALGQAEVTPMELARFVATVASDGVAVTGAPVTRIEDVRGETTLEVPGRGARVMSEESAALTRALMGMVVRFGSGSYTRLGGGRYGYLGPSFGKTGTTDDEKDLWYIGGTADYAGVVWLGYDQPARVGSTAAYLASPLWGWWMRAVYDGREMSDFDEPIPLKKHGLCTLTGKYPNDTCEAFDFPFLPGDKPRGACPLTHSQKKKEYTDIWERRASP